MWYLTKSTACLCLISSLWVAKPSACCPAVRPEEGVDETTWKTQAAIVTLSIRMAPVLRLKFSIVPRTNWWERLWQKQQWVAVVLSSRISVWSCGDEFDPRPNDRVVRTPIRCRIASYWIDTCVLLLLLLLRRQLDWAERQVMAYWAIADGLRRLDDAESAIGNFAKFFSKGDSPK